MKVSNHVTITNSFTKTWMIFNFLRNSQSALNNNGALTSFDFGRQNMYVKYDIWEDVMFGWFKKSDLLRTYHEM